jgi:hypothetical protein
LFGTTRAISEPTIPIARSAPIPTYCPRTTWRVGKERRLAKNAIRINKSSMLVTANEVAPIPMRLIKSAATTIQKKRASLPYNKSNKELVCYIMMNLSDNC